MWHVEENGDFEALGVLDFDVVRRVIHHYFGERSNLGFGLQLIYKIVE